MSDPYITLAQEFVQIPRDTYNELLESHKFLLALEAAGVDNWAGYESAVDFWNENNE